ncbi:DUF1681-domain-containing protein [Cryphonectria parasitica EP155]|uniref:DUF1681-domain-containing protein n=1 Tax=Cryphonectria parasitica (strain ATCC 38755 / EP155) TaxID=660469 RepID=A0A9P4Y6T3_CRYP1|nr:DUF1681-domain-containing protein [Cryphonectria parasitica EP155]KAF3767776.1 DUF1681-domain-containing protein [Cryphonectria parasitica EP155]
MESFDPATGEKLPQDAIQRILFISMNVHVYNIPPLTSTKGHMAAHWTDDPKRHISTCRLRVIETAVPQPGAQGADDKVKTDIVLEDLSTAQLFAAAPYTALAAVEPTLDSSRFFAVRVQDPSGRKATLGIGFEERSEAFDFGVALQDAQKALGLDGGAAVAAEKAQAKKREAEEKRDLSLKEGETITVNLGGKFGRRRPQQEQKKPADEGASLSSFSLPPPPSGNRNSLIAPPPSASAQAGVSQGKTAEDLGFDDGENGEFA